jgi:hypothetical protein
LNGFDPFVAYIGQLIRRSPFSIGRDLCHVANGRNERTLILVSEKARQFLLGL